MPTPQESSDSNNPIDPDEPEILENDLANNLARFTWLIKRMSTGRRRIWIETGDFGARIIW